MAYAIPKVNGIVADLTEYLLQSSIREYPAFAVASAMQIVAACAQGTYLLPDGRPLCLYQLLLAPASGGKGAYFGAMKKILTDVSEQIVGNEPGSREGLRHTLHEWNSRAICQDEVQDFFKKLGSDNPHIQGIGTDLKEIWSGTDRLLSITTKSAVSESVKRPLVSFYGTGTTAETAEQFCGSTVGGGLFSRFQVFFEDTVVGQKRSGKKIDIEMIVGNLYSMFHSGKTEEWKDKGFSEWNEYRRQLLTPKREIRGPQMMPRRKLNITQEADDTVWEYRQRWEQYLLSDPDSVAGAVWDRAATSAVIYAACHALGCRRTEITLQDVNIGIDIAGVSAQNAVKLAFWYAAKSDLQRDMKKVLRTIKRHIQVDKRTICRATHLTGDQVEQILVSLQRSGDVLFTSNRYQLVSDDD